MSNIARIREAMLNANLDALLVLSEQNRFYATGFMASDGGLVITKHEAYFFTDGRYIEAARAAIEDAEVEQVGGGSKMDVRIGSILRDLNIKTLGVEEDSVSYAACLRMEKEYAPARIRPAQAIFHKLRAVKTPEELAIMKRAQAIAELAFDDVLKVLKPGVTEREMAAELTYHMMRRGADGNSVPPIVVAAQRGSLPHGTPTDHKIPGNCFVTMDFGCVKDGYCSDMTRTVALGSVTDEMKKVYDAVLRAQLAGIAAAQPGVTGGAIDKAARDVLAKDGLARYFSHAFGHSLGIEIHENPTARPDEELPLPVGTVMSAEPGVYIPKKFGVRIEDVMVFTEGGVEILTKVPKELLVL